jgi:DtxR family Mn-dependent transcriptional regulator
MKKYGYARVTDVARRLGITRGSASITLKALKERGLVVEDENKFLHLSDEGKALSQSIQSKRKVLIKFFHEVLHMSAEDAEIDACKIEHLISTETGERLLAFIKFLFSDNDQAMACLKAFHSHYIVDCLDPEHCPYCDEDCLLKNEEE